MQYSGHGDKSYDKNLTPSLKLVNVLICNDPLLNIGYICSLNKCMTLHITQLNYVFKCFERTCSRKENVLLCVKPVACRVFDEACITVHGVATVKHFTS